MRIVVHDYAGHPFQLQLSRWLAGQGHQVLHCWCADVETPRGPLGEGGTVAGLALEPLSTGLPVPKYRPVLRWWRDRRYAALAVARTAAFQADAILSANTPPAIQAALLKAARRRRAVFVSWLQDIISEVAAAPLRRAIPVFGGLAARLLRWQEFRVLAGSHKVVAITPDFVPLCVAGGVPADKMEVVPNWAPLEDLPLRPRDNGWARRHGLVGKTVALYSGTLGLKHNPALLAALAAAGDEVTVVVASQGPGRDWLERAKAERGLDNLLLLDFQDFAELPEMLAAADVVIAILEPFAGVLSVPSKVLTYLCAGRPIVGAMPPGNLASRTIREAGAGVVVHPDDEREFVATVLALMADPERRRRMGEAGRRHAEREFDMAAIGPRFLAMLGTP